MKKINSPLLPLAFMSLVLAGCAGVSSPVNGFIYTNTKAPLAVTSLGSSAKVGRASATSILGIIGTGDASVAAAAKDGGITKIDHVDYESKSILGIYGKFTTVVYGE